MIVRHLDEISVAKIVGAIYALMGLIIGLFASLISMLASGLGADTSMGPAERMIMGIFFGAGSIIVLPIFYGVIGFLFSLIGAWIYNVVAGRVGGIAIDVEVEPKDGIARPPTSPSPMGGI